MEWRYIAQRVSTGVFLHMDLPILVQELRLDLSGAGAFRGTLAPEIGGLTAHDGAPLLDEWGTFLYAEADGVIRWGGIILHSKHTGPEWVVEAAGFSTYPHGIVYTDVYKVMNADPLDVVRHIWTNIQSKTDGNIGVTITGATDSPVTLGDPALPAYQEVFVGGVWRKKTEVPPGDILPGAISPLAAKITFDATTLKLKRLDNFDDLTAPYVITIAGEQIQVNGRTDLTLTGLVRGYNGTTATGHYTGTAVSYPGTPERTVLAVPEKPYTLAVWDSPDCGEEIAKLAEETPFEFIEKHYWTGSTIAHEIEIGYPRFGIQRNDLAFIQGDNVTKVVEVDRDGDEFANVVIGIGRGEGNRAIRATASSPDGRLRRTKVRPDKSVATKKRLQALVDRELQARQNIESVIEKITVVDHPNAPIGSWNLGDDILVQATLPWLGEVNLWCRILSWSLDSDTTATLYLTRNYGSPQERLARELAAMRRRITPLERATQLTHSTLVRDDGSEIDFEDNSKRIADLERLATDAMEAADTAYDLALEGGGGGGGGNQWAVYKTAGVWPARPTADATQVVTWIGEMPHPTIVTSGTGGAHEKDLRLVI